MRLVDTYSSQIAKDAAIDLATDALCRPRGCRNEADIIKEITIQRIAVTWVREVFQTELDHKCMWISGLDRSLDCLAIIEDHALNDDVRAIEMVK